MTADKGLVLTNFNKLYINEWCKTFCFCYEYRDSFIYEFWVTKYNHSLTKLTYFTMSVYFVLTSPSYHLSWLEVNYFLIILN